MLNNVEIEEEQLIDENEVEKFETTRAKLFVSSNQLKPEYYSWGNENLHLFEGVPKGKYFLILNHLNELLKANLNDDYEISIVVHDKDVSKNSTDKIIEYVQPHYHMVLETKKQHMNKEIAQILGVEINHLQYPGGSKNASKKYARLNSLSYLTHIKYPEKHQYSPKEVETFGTKDYEKWHNEHLKDFERGRLHLARKDDHEVYIELEEKLLMGTINNSSDIFDCGKPQWERVYAKNRKKLDEIYNYYLDKRAYNLNKKFLNEEINLEVIYIYGESGVGKTYFTTKLMDNIKEHALKQFGEKWEHYSASSKNPMDDFNGEEILYMNDLRSNAMKASDWLNLLDPLGDSRAAARFHNRYVIPKVIILTSPSTPYEYFSAFETKGNEPIAQFLRRLRQIVRVKYYEDEKGIDKTKRIYELFDVRKNIVGDKVNELRINLEEGSIARTTDLKYVETREKEYVDDMPLDDITKRTFGSITKEKPLDLIFDEVRPSLKKWRPSKDQLAQDEIDRLRIKGYMKLNEVEEDNFDDLILSALGMKTSKEEKEEKLIDEYVAKEEEKQRIIEEKEEKLIDEYFAKEEDNFDS